MVLEELILASGQGLYLLEYFLYHIRAGLVVLVGSHSGLEEDVWTLTSASDHGMVGIEGILVKMLFDQLMREDASHVFVRDHLDLGHLS
jgi:hypothetical protein